MTWGRREDNLRARVGVHPASALNVHRRLFSALEAARPVRFVPWQPAAPRCQAIIIVASSGVPPVFQPLDFAVPTLTLEDAPNSPTRAHEVRLSSHDAIDPRLRGVAVRGQLLTSPLADIAESDEVLASSRRGPEWLCARAGVPKHTVNATLPDLGADEVLRAALLDSDRALATIALLHFLLELGNDKWSELPLRATFLFDDPNLRRSRYGFIDYAALVRHADAHGYHAAMAMVPLDTRGSRQSAAAMFRERPDRLSLSIHGNDHSRRELMQPLGLQGGLALGAQALARIARFETRTGLRVDRVMVPPHAMCSPIVTRSLGSLGYDGLCAIHPYPWTEQPPPECLLAGWTPAEHVEGCAVIPRVPLSVSATEIALRAFLGQPLVLYGHHDDLASGLDPLAEAAARVNRVGDVRWCSLGELARSNYQLRLDGGTARVRPWANRLRVAIPAGATAVSVQMPDGVGTARGAIGWSAPELDDQRHTFDAIEHVDGQLELEIRLCCPVERDPRTVPYPPRRLWPLVRRRVTEARDRLGPLRALVR